MKQRAIHFPHVGAHFLPKSFIASFTLMAALPLVSTSALAEIYKWKDESGQVHYSATPPPTKTIDLENISDDIDFHKGTASKKATKSSEKSSTRQNDNTALSSEQQTGQTSDKSKYCDHQTQALKTLKDNEFVKWKNGDEDVILEGDMKAAKVRQLSQDIEKYCSPASSTGSQAITKNDTGGNL